ncbi:MAG TPA: hypothetical protein VHB74_09985, partial [Devosia sp.]|nr:hypothetical protein [Devosia sp.]
ALNSLGALVFASNYRADLPPEETVRQARKVGEILARTYPARQIFANERDPGRRLRVGFVSSDFNLHPVSFFLESVLKAIDGREIELFAYSLSTVSDDMTGRLKAIFAQWRDAAQLAPPKFDQQIVEDGIDILIDLTGHTHSGIPAVFALKSAPVTVSWLGYSGTTGLPTMDYILADEIVAPASEARLFTEQIIRLPNSYLCYTPEPNAPAVSALPALENGHVTFGSFNNINKVSDGTVALWARLLAAVPAAQLALKGAVLRRPEAGDELAARFAAHGIGRERLKLLPYEPEMAGHLGAYAHVDIGLDPFPYNGTTTTCEAMLMGVPVLTLRGDRFIAHVGESLLRSAGLAEWIADDEDQYVAKAVAFAADLPRLARLRAQLRAQLLASPLCDAPRFARDFEAAMREIWRRWCESAPPAP